MPGLILKLGPGERFVANGVVIENALGSLVQTTLK